MMAVRMSAAAVVVMMIMMVMLLTKMAVESRPEQLEDQAQE